MHGKKAPDDEFLPFLAVIETHATDARNFVRKAVNWALRQIGKHSAALHAPALALAQRLAASDDRDRALDRQGRGQGARAMPAQRRAACGRLIRRDVAFSLSSTM